MNTVESCQSCKKDFVIEPDDFGFYEQMKVPAPTWCPSCRRLRRLAWTGHYKLYKRRCSKTGEEVISIYHPDLPYTTYRQDIWWGDSWDAKDYGREYDFSRPFFEQFDELLKSVPLPVLQTEQATMINSPYCNGASELRNCHLCFMADRSENSGYSHSVSFLKDCYDLTFSNYNELCYFGLNLRNCYGALFSRDCVECQNVYFSADLTGCSDCFGCIGLRKKQYHIWNQPYTKEEYQKKIKEFDFGSHQKVEEYKKKAEEHFLNFPHKNFHTIKAYNSSGDYIYNCKNVKNSYWVETGEDIRYTEFLQAMNTSKAYDYSGFSFNVEWVYECAWVGISTNNVKFTYWNYSAHDIEYCFGCHSSGNLFGCVGVRTGEYCILNKQYTKEEYYALVERIKEQMKLLPYVDRMGREYRYGEFFPIDICPWRYNESRACDYFPKTKEQALKDGFLWRDPDMREYKESLAAIPDTIRDTTDDILKEILKCETCGKNFRLIQLELQFYRRMNIPIPHHCDICRNRQRLAKLNPMDIYERNCMKCGNPIESSYPLGRPEVVYCESCYQNEVA